MRPLRNLSLLALLLLGGCASGQIIGPREHILLSDARGRPLDPAVPARQREPMSCGFDSQLNGLFSSMKAYFGEKPSRPPKITIFIHGGLNNPKSTVRRAASLYDVIKRDGAYPVFVNWDSSLWNSLGHHYFFVRNGRWNPDAATWTSGIVFFADFVRALGRIPVTTYQQGVEHVIRNWRMKFSPSERPWNKRYCALRQEYEGEPEKALAVSAQRKRDSEWGGFKATLSFVLKIPFKFLSAPFLDAFAPSAWNVMERRTTLLFEDEEQLEETRSTGREDKCRHEGSLAVFLRRLQDEMEAYCAERPSQGTIDEQGRPVSGKDEGPPGSCVEVTLIGHSMGAIVLNKILERHPELPARNLVYMAAADSIASYQKAAWSYLRRPGNENTDVYHLLLDDFSEIREAYVWDLVPRGSLLVWIDEFLTNPETPWDRTAGRLSNLALTLDSTPADLQDRINVKVFGSGKRSRCEGPLSHGDFDGDVGKKDNDWTGPLRFWQEASWRPDGPDDGLSWRADRRCGAETEVSKGTGNCPVGARPQ